MTHTVPAQSRTAAPAPEPTFDLSQLDNDLPGYVFLRESQRRGLSHHVVRPLPAAHTAEILPEDHHLLLGVDGGHGQDHVAVIEACVVWLDSWTAGGRIRVAGPDHDRALTVATTLLERAPRPVPAGAVRVEFADHQIGSRHIDLAVGPWDSIAHLYPESVAAAITRLVDHRPADDGPRVLLWHGRPGTGKTTAVRALLDAWRDWTEPVVISDPEALLGDGRYLRRVLLDAEEDRWRLIVMEDAESLLRPGRCLSLLEFGALSAAEAARLHGGPVRRPMTLAEVMSREVDLVREPPRTTGHLYL